MEKTNFNFSIVSAVKKSWAIFRLRPLFYIVLALVLVILNTASDIHKERPVVMLLVVICSIIWSYTWYSLSLSSVDEKSDLLTFKSIGMHFPNFRQFIYLVVVGLLTGLATLAGFILLVIPGIYVMTKLSLANLSFVDRQEGIRASLKHSWGIVKGDIFWTVLLTILVSGLLLLIGAISFGIGLIVTYPMSAFLMAQLYRAVNKHYMENKNLATQPQEIPAHTS